MDRRSVWSSPKASLAVLALVAGAQVARAAPPGDTLQARLSGSADLVSGTQTRDGQQTTYQGLSASDVVLEGWGWLSSDSLLGLNARLEREGLGVFDGTTRVGTVGLLYASVAPTLRFSLGPVRLEPSLGYSYVQVPDASRAAPNVLGAVGNHAVLLAARGQVALGTVHLEGRFGAFGPIASDAGAVKVSAPVELFWGAGAQVTVLQGTTADWGIRVDFEQRALGLDAAAVGSLAVNRMRLGLGLEARLHSPLAPKPIAPVTGTLRVVALDATGQPQPKAAVSLELPPAPATPLPLAPDGTAVRDALSPGEVVLRATLEGHLPAEARVAVIAGQLVEARLVLEKEPPKLGGLIVTVKDQTSGAPVAKAKVAVGGRTEITDAQGTARFSGLAPGAVALVVMAPGYTDANEAASIVAGVDSPADLVLQPAAVKAPARISGRIRSARGGAPVQAELALAETRLQTKTEPNGTFLLKLPSGSYTITITAPGYVTQTKRVSVREAEEAIFNVNLVPK